MTTQELIGKASQTLGLGIGGAAAFIAGAVFIGSAIAMTGSKPAYPAGPGPFPPPRP